MQSVFQAGERDYLHSVRTRVGHSASRDDYKEVGFAHLDLSFSFVVFLNQTPDLKEMFRPFFNFSAAEFAFNQSIPSVGKVQCDIHFEFISVVVVCDMTVLAHCICL